jgi:hypothetical protein
MQEVQKKPYTVDFEPDIIISIDPDFKNISTDIVEENKNYG